MENETAPNKALQSLPLCDVVMEGGVTSGIIYPTAVVELSQRFRLKNIGGTSVGALAAAVTAAAELGRLRQPGANAGYERLAALPQILSAAGFTAPRVSRLFDLFQPQPQTRRLFDILTASLNRNSKLDRAKHVLLAAVRAYAVPFAGTAVAVLALQWLVGQGGVWNWLVACLFALVCGVVALCLVLWTTVKGPFVRNGFGLCTGYLGDDDGNPVDPNPAHAPLTLWLSREINLCAGMDADGPPLTFGALWNPPQAQAAPPDWLQRAGITEWRYIDLQMITTNVTHGRPYRFPYLDDDQQLFFDPVELRNWFPPNVIAHLVEHADTYAPNMNMPPLRNGLYKLPAAAELPVVFAARLSLSFPFLLSAVPLWAIDYESKNLSEHGFKRCWFSDGGITSNFPIHFFDAPLPLWPTFGIMLADERKYHQIGTEVNGLSANRFFLPPHNQAGRGDTFARFDDAEDGGDKLFGFAGAILNSARFWQNTMLARAPAVRDRVVRVYLKADEGGLNLNMPEATLDKLAQVGQRAAGLLASRFAPDSSDAMNFKNHRYVRLRNLIGVVEADLSTIHNALAAVRMPTLEPADIVIDTLGAALPPEEYGATEAQRDQMQAILEALARLSAVAAGGNDLLAQDAPRRRPVLRIVPDI
jgi:predicted acylesterase/phospholipase RssA